MKGGRFLGHRVVCSLQPRSDPGGRGLLCPELSYAALRACRDKNVNVQMQLYELDHMYTVSQKTRHLTLAHNFTKYWPIFTIRSLSDSVGNL